MRYIDLRLSLPDWMLHPIQEFIRTEDVVRYEEMLTWRVRPDEGIEYALYYIEAELAPYRRAVREIETVIDCRITPIDDDSAYVWACEETRPETRAWREAFADRQLIVVPPVRFDDTAAMEMTIVGDGSDIRDLLETMPTDVDVTVNEIGTYDRRGGTLAGTLTDRQLAAASTALELGYYEVPREATLADVAAELECAESTTSELLRRAERDVLSRVLRRYGGGVGG
ncbi:Bacterio-opsin activator HTH domain-containing protein [Haloferax larsenii JCM 13917]|nr:helix-turn-helix domain-containing protein [Haloferax larsenii]ELZ79436.1 Bacterio-opsin activator HTH domain-containing protein [Haloferax larsenii JCM 13917]